VRREENELVAEAFLRDHPELAPLPFVSPWDGACPGGMLQLWPQRQGTDGFFIAVMRKASD